MSNYIINLLSHMDSNGLTCNKEIQLDGRFHRYTNDGHDLDEWYIGHEIDNNHIYCTYGTWSGEFTKFTFKSWDSNEDIHYSSKIAELNLITEKTIQEEQERAADECLEYWNAAAPAKKHDYLAKKKIKPHIARIKDNNLVLPLYDLDGKLWTIQRIYSDGKKRFAQNGKTQTCFATLGNIENENTLYFAEGFATAASIYEAIHKPVIIAYSAHNLAKCAVLVKDKHPNKRLILCRDLGTAGDKTEKQWNEFNLGEVITPKIDPSKGKDFNDIHVFLGLDELKKQLNTKKCQPIYMEDFLLSDIKPVEWLLSPFLVKGSINLLYADAGVGKSNFSLELAWCLASKQRFLKWTPEKHFKILYIDGEMTHSEIKYKIDFISERYPSFPLEKYFQIYTSEMVENAELSPIDLYNPSWHSMLEAQFEETDLIVLDNISCLTGVGEGDNYENKGESWIMVGAWLKKWKRKGKTFLILHHSNKAGSSRGTGRIKCDLTTTIKLQEHKTDNYNFAFEIHFEKARNTIPKDKASLICELDPQSNYAHKWTIKPIKQHV